ncbi:Succinate dehydrogenase assembly factor 4, mitochondrial [Pseudozyma hubeiensis]|nr:Succinate dehydrogenase assembly factor 4, mitochondrial [Pseudozyma hubeiensis]
MLSFAKAVTVPSLRRTIATSTRRALCTTPTTHSGGFNRPGPPPLPPQEQKEFEQLVKQKQNASPFLSSSDPEKGEMHPDARRKPKAEFEGETNPGTGEIGGPKNDPLKYEKEWTYGGRATDF